MVDLSCRSTKVGHPLALSLSYPGCGGFFPGGAGSWEDQLFLDFLEQLHHLFFISKSLVPGDFSSLGVKEDDHGERGDPQLIHFFFIKVDFYHHKISEFLFDFCRTQHGVQADAGPSPGGLDF